MVVALVLVVKVFIGMVLVLIALVHLMHMAFLVVVVLVVVALVLVVKVFASVMLVLIALVHLMGMCSHFSLLKDYISSLRRYEALPFLLNTLKSRVSRLK